MKTSFYNRKALFNEKASLTDWMCAHAGMVAGSAGTLYVLAFGVTMYVVTFGFNF